MQLLIPKQLMNIIYHIETEWTVVVTNWFEGCLYSSVLRLRIMQS